MFNTNSFSYIFSLILDEVKNIQTTNRVNLKGDANFRVFIALFDYDPFKMSPNTDSCQEELPFKEGQLIKVFGDQDSDGFYYGESNGRLGYIPCNMVSEVQVDDPEVVRQLLLDTSMNSANQSNPIENEMVRKGSGKNINSQQTNSSTGSSSKNKTTKQQSITKMQTKEQSFVPINNYQYKSQSTPSAKNTCTMIALYDYDPQSLSPNVDADVKLYFLFFKYLKKN